jgi:hypothetical protein
MGGRDFLTDHGRVLLCIAHDPGGRLRDIAAMVGITAGRQLTRGNQPEASTAAGTTATESGGISV